MKGWFDAFRTEGGPTLYSYSNRTPVTGDLPTITIYVIFFTLFLAFLIIFPGVRKERFTTFTTVTLSLFVGAVILVTNQGSCWHVSESVIESDYIAFSPNLIQGKLGVYIGLKHINITLESKRNPEVDYSQSDSEGNYSSYTTSPTKTLYSNNFLIDYNERFHWDEPEQIRAELKEAMKNKGLPYPILTVVKYLSSDNEDFCWGRTYRLAGFCSSFLLWSAFASWLLMNLLLIVVPRYGAYQMIITSVLMLSSNVIYWVLLPEHPLAIHFEEQVMEFQFGWSYWLVAIAGSLCGFVGLVIALVDLIYPHSFSTILEVDYDTPYDRHIIIEESFKGKGRGRSLEDPIDTSIGFGRKILRTLSSKSRTGNEKGLVNNGFEMDPPKSPWANYNRIMNQQHGQKRLNEIGNNSLMNAMAKNPNLARLAAPNHIILNGGATNNGAVGGIHNGIKTPKSVSFRRQSRLEQTFDIRKRDDSDDEISSNCSSHSDTPQREKSLNHFQAPTQVELLSNRNTLEDSATYVQPKLFPRVSYDSQANSNSNSRRGSNESTDNDSSHSSLSEFSSNSFDITSNNPKNKEKRRSKDGGIIVGNNSHHEYATPSFPPSSSPPSNPNNNVATNNLGATTTNNKVNNEW